MSMCRCEGCDQIIDSDDDPDCFVPDPRMSLANHPDRILCEWCREKLEEATDRMDTAERFFSPDQMAIIDRISAEHDEEEQDGHTT